MKTLKPQEHKTTFEITLKFEVSGMTEQEAKDYFSSKLLSGQIAIASDENIALVDISGGIFAS